MDKRAQAVAEMYSKLKIPSYEDYGQFGVWDPKESRQTKWRYKDKRDLTAEDFDEIVKVALELRDPELYEYNKEAGNIAALEIAIWDHERGKYHGRIDPWVWSQLLEKMEKGIGKTSQKKPKPKVIPYKKAIPPKFPVIKLHYDSATDYLLDMYWIVDKLEMEDYDNLFKVALSFGRIPGFSNKVVIGKAGTLTKADEVKKFIQKLTGRIEGDIWSHLTDVWKKFRDKKIGPEQLETEIDAAFENPNLIQHSLKAKANERVKNHFFRVLKKAKEARRMGTFTFLKTLIDLIMYYQDLGVTKRPISYIEELPGVAAVVGMSERVAKKYSQWFTIDYQTPGAGEAISMIQEIVSILHQHGARNANEARKLLHTLPGIPKAALEHEDTILHRFMSRRYYVPSEVAGWKPQEPEKSDFGIIKQKHVEVLK